MIRWLTRNIRSFLLALALGVAVWVTAVTAANPDETQAYPNPIPIEIIGQDPGLVMTGAAVPGSVEVTLRAPHSVWQGILAGESSIHAVADLAGLGTGTHLVNVQIQIDASPVRIISVTPRTFNVSLEPQVTRTLTINLTLTGNPAIGYQSGIPILNPSTVVISGAQSIVSQINQVQASIDLANARQNIDTTVQLQALDSNGKVINGAAILPASAKVSLPIIQQGGYRDLAVKVMTVGNPAAGYSLTSVAALPPIVTVYSADTATIDAMPGYVETLPLDLSGAQQDIQKQLEINLPSGVTLIGDQSVLVVVGIAPIQSSRMMSYRPVEMIGLGPRLVAHISPQTVDVILSGPSPVLDALALSDVHVRVDLTGLTIGTYQLTPKVTILVNQNVLVESILPGTVEVVITGPVTPTP